MVCIKSYYGKNKAIIDEERVRKIVNSTVFSAFYPNSMSFLWMKYFDKDFTLTYRIAKVIERTTNV